jgi:hypothetical protein
MPTSARAQRPVTAKVVDTKSSVALETVPPIFPESVDPLLGKEMTYSVGPALLGQIGISIPNLRSIESVIDPAFGLIHVEGSRHDVKVADQEGRNVQFQDISGMSMKPLEPAQFVIKLRPRGRIAVWKVKASYQDTVDRCFNIATLLVVWIARKASARYERFRPSDKYRNAIPGFLTVPSRSIPRTANFPFSKRG